MSIVGEANGEAVASVSLYLPPSRFTCTSRLVPFDNANFVNPLIAQTCDDRVEDQSVDPEIGLEFGRWFLGAASRFVAGIDRIGRLQRRSLDVPLLRNSCRIAKPSRGFLPTA